MLSPSDRKLIESKLRVSAASPCGCSVHCWPSRRSSLMKVILSSRAILMRLESLNGYASSQCTAPAAVAIAVIIALSSSFITVIQSVLQCFPDITLVIEVNICAI